MSDLRERAPAAAAMQKLLSYRGSDDLRQLPFGMIRPSKEALMWLRGVRGELLMAERLSYLGEGWEVLHSVMVERFVDIDHIVVGPPGVFPINTKRLLDREIVVDGDVFRSDGWKKKYLAKSAIEARRVDSILRRARIVAPVLPIIAISGAERVKLKGSPHWRGRNIGVAPVEQVARKLVRRPVRLQPEQVRAIAALLRDSQSWRGAPAQSDDVGLTAEFRRVDRGIARFARAVHVAAFGIVGVALVGAGFWFNWLVAPPIVDYIGSLYAR